MHVVGSVKHERPSLQQMAKWRNRPVVVHRGLHVVLPCVSWFQGRLYLLLCHFVLVSCSRVCLLDVSRLRGLTLRHFAPVCSCHRDSLTRGRLAIVQEAVRVLFFLSLLDWSLHVMTCVRWFLTAYEEGPSMRC